MLTFTLSKSGVSGPNITLDQDAIRQITRIISLKLALTTWMKNAIVNYCHTNMRKQADYSKVTAFFNSAISLGQKDIPPEHIYHAIQFVEQLIAFITPENMQMPLTISFVNPDGRSKKDFTIFKEVDIAGVITEYLDCYPSSNNLTLLELANILKTIPKDAVIENKIGIQFLKKLF